MEFLIQRGHTVREYQFTLEQWSSLGGDVAYECAGNLAEWVAGFAPGGAAGLALGLICPAGADVAAGLVGPPAHTNSG
jgi:hypothetical protein